jgi:peptidyl-prolyl cis-trans isomerase D
VPSIISPNDIGRQSPEQSRRARSTRCATSRNFSLSDTAKLSGQGGSSMPMMKQLRDSTKAIMIIVAIAFVGLMVFEWGMELSGTTSQGTSGSALGSVNGAEIALEDYQRQYQILYQAAERQDPDGELSAEDLERIEQEAWESVIDLTLLEEEARRRGIQVTDRELVEFIKGNPPPDIVELPAFQTEGQFDLQKYQQALADPALAETWAEYERQLRSRLPINKLQEQIAAGIAVTDLELLEQYRTANERARIAYLYLDPNRLVSADRMSITDEEIGDYYEKNKEAFRRDESATIRYVGWRPPVTAADSVRVRAIADSLAELARAPEADFASLAERHSDDRTTVEIGGDLGWIDPAAMNPAFTAALAALQPGQVSDPFLTPFGWHVVKLEERSEEDGEPRAKARQILLAIEPNAAERQRVRGEAQAFARAASEGPEAFDRAAAQRGLQVSGPPTFEKGVVVPGLGVAPAVSAFVFANPSGSISNPLEEDNAVYVVRVDARYPAGTVALSRLRDEIRDRLLHQKRLSAVRELAPQVVASVRQGGLEAASQRYGLEVQTTDWFTRENNIPGIGSATPVAGTAFGLAQGQTAGPIETERGLYFVRLIEKQGIDERRFEEVKSQLREELRRQKMGRTVSAWFESLKENAEIEDNRAELLGDP